MKHCFLDSDGTRPKKKYPPYAQKLLSKTISKDYQVGAVKGGYALP